MQWNIFQSKLSRLNKEGTGSTETRNFWVLPLMGNLGYDFQYFREAEEINGKSFWINNRDNNLGGFPLFIAGYNESLDKRPDNRQLRVSPHALIQEYLNYSEHLYGIVTNGRQLRLLRDASRITRLSYVEFNLQKIMEEDLYADFVILYRLLHASRMPQKIDEGAESIIEKYHQEGLEAGSTIRNKLGNAVKESIKSLANGFINHPDNNCLRLVMQDGKLNADDYYHYMLRIIYRLLFLFVIEERNLVYADHKTPETKRFSEIYFKYYSLLRLRKLSRNLPPPDANRHYDLWQSLLSTFALFEKKEIGEKLGIMALQGDLFNYDSINNHIYDLHECRLSNTVLLKILNALGYFENENGVLIVVNYGGLDVEEFGSVYEGLLELKLIVEPVTGTEKYSCRFDTSGERSKSGSHYTPEELVQPLIKHSLEYLIEDRIKPYQQKKATKESTIQSLLSLKICDVACGSGHILLSAARRAALEIARIQTDEEQPNPLAVRKAIKQVIRQCIYGVDKNPLAVELCKIALWLESHNPGEPLNFLDHHIKCGDAIVGLAHKEELEKGIADEAFKTLPGDNKEIASAFLRTNRLERKQQDQTRFDFEGTIRTEIEQVIEKYNLFKNLPERTPEEVAAKAKAHTLYEQDIHRIRLRQLADAQVAQFFIRKTIATKDILFTDAEYRSFLRQVNKGIGVLQSNKLACAQIEADVRRFFHWFLEFPEVFNAGGFDCVLGNPPFLGGQKLSGSFGDAYLEYIKYEFAPIGAVDLVIYFFRRIFSIIKQGGFQSLISTNTIAQGKAREDGLDIIVQQGGAINHAVKSMKWPGLAALEVSLITIFKGKFKGTKILDNHTEDSISTFLDNNENSFKPYIIETNLGRMFKGVTLLGDGFLISKEEYKSLMENDEKNKEVILPYLNGYDLNDDYKLDPKVYCISFFDFDLGKAKQFELVFSIVDKKVRPEREKLKDSNPAKTKWWIHERNRMDLYRRLKGEFYSFCKTTKYLGIYKISGNYILSQALFTLPDLRSFEYTIIQSSLHEEFARKLSPTLETRLQYTNTTCFETFPFPQNPSSQQEHHLEAIGEAYHEHRRQLMLCMQLGLTKTYNLFHSKYLTTISIEDKYLEDKLFEKKFGKDALQLRKHLTKPLNTCSFNEAVEGIFKLRELHVQVDNAVLEAYGWQDIRLQHNFYEVDYLPENDRARYTIHPDARKEVLKRLLELNHKIHEEEVRMGLWDKKGKKKNYSVAEDGNNELNEEEVNYGLFNQK